MCGLFPLGTGYTFLIGEAGLDHVAESILKLMPAWRAERIGRTTYLDGGYANDNYRFEYGGEPFVIRIVREPAAPRDAEMRYLELPLAPDVVAADRVRGDLITRWIEGTLLAEIPAGPREMAMYLRELHGAVPQGIRRYDAVEVVRDYLRDAPVSAIAAVALRHLEWSVAETAGCHNDLNPWNVIRSGASWRTLDWEFAGDNDPLFDLVGLGYGMGYRDDAFDALVGGYYRDRPSDERLVDTRILYQLREHAWAARQVRAGNARDEIAAQVVTTERELERLVAGRRR